MCIWFYFNINLYFTLYREYCLLKGGDFSTPVFFTEIFSCIKLRYFRISQFPCITVESGCTAEAVIMDYYYSSVQSLMNIKFYPVSFVFSGKFKGRYCIFRSMAQSPRCAEISVLLNISIFIPVPFLRVSYE